MVSFLIRIGDEFVAGLDPHGKPLCVGVPSAARHCDYRTADEVCQVLRVSGFQAYVCNLVGEPATLDVIQEESASK